MIHMLRQGLEFSILVPTVGRVFIMSCELALFMLIYDFEFSLCGQISVLLFFTFSMHFVLNIDHGTLYLFIFFKTIFINKTR